MERKIIFNDGESLERVVKRFIKDEMVELACQDGMIVITPKKIQCSVCGMTDENSIVQYGGIYMCNDCISHLTDNQQ